MMYSEYKKHYDNLRNFYLYARASGLTLIAVGVANWIFHVEITYPLAFFLVAVVMAIFLVVVGISNSRFETRWQANSILKYESMFEALEHMGIVIFYNTLGNYVDYPKTARLNLEKLDRIIMDLLSKSTDVTEATREEWIALRHGLEMLTNQMEALSKQVVTRN